MGLAKARHHVVVPALRIGVFLVHERDPAEATRQGSHEIGICQIPFETAALLPVAVEEKDSRRPDRFKSVEPCGMFLDVSFDWHEMPVDEVGCFLVGVRLGFQPSASASSRPGPSFAARMDIELSDVTGVRALRSGTRRLPRSAQSRASTSPGRW